MCATCYGLRYETAAPTVYQIFSDHLVFPRHAFEMGTRQPLSICVRKKGVSQLLRNVKLVVCVYIIRVNSQPLPSGVFHAD